MVDDLYRLIKPHKFGRQRRYSQETRVERNMRFEGNMDTYLVHQLHTDE
jgi:hypothetical protein